MALFLGAVFIRIHDLCQLFPYSAPWHGTLSPVWEWYMEPACLVAVPGIVGSGEGDRVSSGARPQAPSSFSEGPVLQTEPPRLSLAQELEEDWPVLVSPGQVCPNTLRPVAVTNGVEKVVSVLPMWPSGQVWFGVHFLLVPKGCSWAKQGPKWGSGPSPTPRYRTWACGVS